MAARAVRRRAGCDDGVAAVEFVLILPLFLVLLFGVMSFGMVLWVLVNANGAARESARLAAVGEACGNVTSGWIGDTIDRVRLAPVALTSATSRYSSTDGAATQPGDTVTVKLIFSTNSPDQGSLLAVTEMFGASVLLPDTFTVTAKSRIEVVNSECTYP